MIEQKLHGIIEYDIKSSYSENLLTLALRVEDESSSKVFSRTLSNQNLSAELKKEYDNIENLYKLLGNKSNCIVDDISGSLVLIKKEFDKFNEVFHRYLRI